MEIMIDIPEQIYETIQADMFISREQLAVLQMQILKGVELPARHGRLIDADVLVDGIEDDYDFCEVVNATPTIIEADKESENA